jgi:hypothetical protein
MNRSTHSSHNHNIAVLNTTDMQQSRYGRIEHTASRMGPDTLLKIKNLELVIGLIKGRKNIIVDVIDTSTVYLHCCKTFIDKISTFFDVLIIEV